MLLNVNEKLVAVLLVTFAVAVVRSGSVIVAFTCVAFVMFATQVTVCEALAGLGKQPLGCIVSALAMLTSTASRSRYAPMRPISSLSRMCVYITFLFLRGGVLLPQG